MFKRSSTHYGETPTPETPYARASQVWDNRIGTAQAQAHNWRLLSLGCLLLSFILVGFLVWQSNRSIITPYVIEVSETGQTRTVGEAAQRYNPTDAQIAYHLSAFIKNVRSVSIDPVIVRENWLAAYNYTTDQGALTLNDYARENDPFAAIGRNSVSIEIVSVVRSSKDSFELRWREILFEGGKKSRVDHYTGSITIAIDQPNTVETLRQNPLGIYIHGINWSKDHIVAGDVS